MQTQTPHNSEFGSPGASAIRRRIAVVGAGIAGLAAAYELFEATKDWSIPPEIMILEGQARAGGVICTYQLDDTTIELGPDCFNASKPGVHELAKRLGITGRIIGTNTQFRRTFVAWEKKLYALPDGFLLMAPTKLLPFLTSDLFSQKEKLRILKELTIPRRPASDNTDESLSEFVTRRFGAELLEKVAQPMVGGIFSGNPELLSMQSVLPTFWELEAKHGSVIAGLIKQSFIGPQAFRQGAGARYGMFASFDEGMEVLVTELLAKLPPNCLHTHTLGSMIRKANGLRPWQLTFADESKLDVDGIIICGSALQASNMLATLDRELASNLSGITYAPSAVLNLVYRRADIPHPLDGFGFVVPRREDRAIMACSFSSVKFPGRAPDDKALLRVFLGGALQTDIYEFADEQIECLLWEDLRTYLGIESLPLLSIISRYPRAMPQFNRGHKERIAKVRTALANHPGIKLAGNYFAGVGVADAITTGTTAAQELLVHLAAQIEKDSASGEEAAV